MAGPKYYITTPIYYATDEPHIGHAYCTIASDAIARYHRLIGDDVRFLTGTDEHGQKMERQAEQLGIEPRMLADRTAPRYQELWRSLGISHDDFIRTTEPRHHRAVAEIWSRMLASGDIYRGDYEGRYCFGCEAFYLERELEDGKCPQHGTVPEAVKESGWFFRLSAYQDRLLALYASDPPFVRPESRRNEVDSFVRSGLRDLSISRGTTRWGIPVPDDPAQVIYVWVDALTNYLSGIGWPDGDAGRWWPADLHVLGKDILRFHAVYWPAFLMSAGLPLPKAVFAHGWWLRDGKKISKSSTAAIRVQPFVETFGADALRYFVLREIPFGADGAFSDEAFVQRYNADLANDFGNLVSRALQMIGRYREGVIPPGPADFPAELREAAERAIASYRREFADCAIARAIDAAWELVRLGNRFVDSQAPWALARDADKQAELDRVLYSCAELVRLVALLLSPVMPGKCATVQGWLGLDAAGAEARDLVPGRLQPGGRIGTVEPLFPRVDEKQWLYTTPGKGGNKLSDDPSQAPIPAPAAAPVAPAPAATPAAAPSVAPAPAAAPELISIDEFFKADLRVGRIKSAERVEKSKKLLRIIVDLGPGGERQVVAGIAEKYAPETLIGKCVTVVANLKPAKLMGVESQGMLLAASLDGLPILSTFAEDVPPGTKVK